MKTSSGSAMFVGFLLVGLMFGSSPALSRSGDNTGRNCDTIISPQEYEVLGDLLRAEAFPSDPGYFEASDMLGGESPFSPDQARLVVSEYTSLDWDLLDTGRLAMPLYIKNNLPGLKPETLSDLLRKNRITHQLKPCFNLDFKYKLLSPEEQRQFGEDSLDFWTSFYQVYPRFIGIHDVSRVGFDSSMTQALLYMGCQREGLWGIGLYILMEREEDTWVIKETVMSWIS